MTLPHGWTICRIKDLIEMGPRNSVDDNIEVGFVPLQRLGTRYRDVHSFETRLWADVKSGYTHFRDGDVLLARITPSFENGKAGIARHLPNGIGAGSTEYIVCRPNQGAVCAEYLLGFFKTRDFLMNGEQLMSGAVGQQRVPKTYVANCEIPLAPLNEQKRIADKLDSLLARVDACRERLDRIPTILKRLRQSILAAACSGRLTADWRESNELNDSWETGTLESVIEGKPRNGYSPRGVEFETSVKSLTLSATTTGRLLLQHHKYIDEKIPADSHLWLQDGDILIQRANTLEYVGVSVLFRGPANTFIYPDLMMKCRANDRVIPQFLSFVLLSDPVREYFRANATGTAGNMPKINQQTVMNAPVSWPSLAEQHEIVARVQNLFASADDVENRLKRTQTLVSRLTPSSLSKAFRGELVPQDPNDEPAEDLLHRIRVRTEPAARKTSRKKTRANTTKADD